MRQLFLEFLKDMAYELIDKFREDPPDFRGIPTAACPVCGHGWFQMAVSFDENYEVKAYMLDAQCDTCGALLTAPTPIDLIEAE